jgi:hypothetical protein
MIVWFIKGAKIFILDDKENRLGISAMVKKWKISQMYSDQMTLYFFYKDNTYDLEDKCCLPGMNGLGTGF